MVGDQNKVSSHNAPSLLTCIQEEGGFIKVNQSYARIGGGPLLPARAREMDPRQTCVVEQVSPPTYT